MEDTFWTLDIPDPKETPKLHHKSDPLPEYGNKYSCYTCSVRFETGPGSKLYYDREDQMGKFKVFIQLCDGCYYYYITKGLK